MIARSGQTERILLVCGGGGGKVAIRPVLEASQLTGSGQVHFAHSCGGVAAGAEMRSEGRDLGRQDSALGRHATGQ